MGALVTVMVSPHLADGCAVAKDAIAALIADGWTPPAAGESENDAGPQHPTQAVPALRVLATGVAVPNIGSNND